MSKEAVVIVLDVGRSMRRLLEGDDKMAAIDSAKHAIRLMIQQKLLFTKQDEMGIVLVGTEDTRNPLAAETEGYQNVSILSDIRKPSLSLLESIATIEVNEAEGDMVDGLIVAMHMLRSRVGKLKFTKRIFLVTDAGSPIIDDPEAAQKITECLVKEEFKLNIIGVNFSEEDEEDEEEGIKAEREDRKPNNLSSSSTSSSSRTEVELQNERILREIADQCNGAVFPLRSAIEILAAFRSRSINQVTKLRGTLQISEKFAINIYSYAFTAMQNMPSLKKYSKLAEEINPDGSWSIAMDRRYWNKLKEDAAEEISRDQCLKSFRYGKEQVPFLPEDIEQLKYECERGIKVLQFVKADKIDRFQYMGTVDCIVAEPGDYTSALALSALIHALYEKDSVAVVRYVKRKNSNPLFGTLTALINPDLECLYFNQLPYVEDVRDFTFRSLEDVAVTPNQKQAAIDLIKNMNLMEAGIEDGEPCEALQSKTTFNPALQRFYQCVERRALDPDADISELDPVISKYVLPDASLMLKAAPYINNFKNSFQLKKVEESEKKQKRQWRDYFDNPAVLGDEDIDAVKRARGDGENKEEFASLDSQATDRFDRSNSFFDRPAESVGAVNPVEDFRSMLRRRDDVTIIDRAIEQMKNQIVSFVVNSWMDAQFPRALAALKALREGCIEMEAWETFNQYLIDLKQLTKKKETFWKLISDEMIYPIHQEEVPSSTLTKEQAEKFYGEVQETAPAPVAAAPLQQQPAEPDLFDSME